MEVIKKGKYPEKNKVTCEECGTMFRFYNSECSYEYTTEDEESIFGGYGFSKSVRCPMCNHRNIIDSTFTPYEPNKFWEDFTTTMAKFGENLIKVSKRVKETLIKKGDNNG